MNLFKPFSFTWQQGLLYKWGVFVLGIAAGSYWPALFAGHVAALILFAVAALVYPTYAWWQQVKA